ncbi:recombinase family protein [Alicyclobacillus fodiniaquatilis]|uniref:Recombinase family protein n=1 Tax=Alicyclobacillus fodiniaquatilis TaxID=1661150 RepID=A0ABW4JBF2_9BACL
MRPAIYIRVSTGNQAVEGHSLDVQLDDCYAQVEKLGFDRTEVVIFREAGASGEDMDRPELMRLIECAKQHELSHVIVKHPDRLSRNMADKAIIVRELQKLGVELVFVDVPDWDKSDEANLLFNIISSIAEYELRQIRRRTLSGKLRAAKEGQLMPMGIDPYGYRYDSGNLVVIEEEAQFVRSIFRWYAHEGLSLREIAARLDELGVPTKTGRSLHWSHATIGRILANELYTGCYFYNRRMTQKVKRATSTLTPSRIRRVKGFRPRSEWISVSVPPIIDTSTFQLAAHRRQTKRHQGTRQTHQHLLQGLPVCALCGSRWHAAAYRDRGGRAYRFYRRPANRSGCEQVCAHQCKSIRAERVEQQIWQLIATRVLTSRELVAEWQAHTQAKEARLKESEEQMGRQLAQLLQMEKRLLNLHMTGGIERTAYEIQVARVREQRAGLEKQQDEFALRRAALKRLMQTHIDALVQMLQSSCKNLELISFAIRQRMVSLLVEQVAVDAHDKTAVELTLTGPISYLGCPSKVL